MKTIPNAFVTAKRVEVASVNFIADVYEELIEYEGRGAMEIYRYHCMSEKALSYYHKKFTEIILEHNFLERTDDYPMFLKEKFPEAWQEACKIRKSETSRT